MMNILINLVDRMTDIQNHHERVSEILVISINEIDTSLFLSVTSNILA